MIGNKLYHDDEVPRVWLGFQITRKGCMRGCLMLPILCGVIYVLSIVFASANYVYHYRRWTGHALQNYDVNIAYGTAAGFYNEFHEVVRDGKRADRAAQDSRPTILYLFDRARTCANMGNIFCTVHYDPHFGYPTYISEFDLDLGNLALATELTPAPTILP